MTSNEGPDLRPYTDTAKQVGVHFGVSARTVKRWATRKVDPCPHRFLGGLFRFNLAEVCEWADRQSKALAS